MKTTKCFECGKQARVINRIRDTVPLTDMAHNCYWYECACGHQSWVYISRRAMPILRRRGLIRDA